MKDEYKNTFFLMLEWMKYKQSWDFWREIVITLEMWVVIFIVIYFLLRILLFIVY